MKLKIENVRGFVGCHELDVRPLTIIVGENSSGKSTLLAALNAALGIDFPLQELFNVPPFELGTYDTIATYRGGKFGRASKFKIGWETDKGGGFAISATFVSRQGLPKIDYIEMQCGSDTLEGSLSTGAWQLTHLTPEKTTRTVAFNVAADSGKRKLTFLGELPSFYLAAHTRLADKVREAERMQAFDAIRGFTQALTTHRTFATALAPLRTRPKRTYDQFISETSPEGAHIPLVLAQLLGREGSSKDPIAMQLSQFGHESGLFKEINVRRLGRSVSDPFQLRVKFVGPETNLIDVGYGVSQSLPVVVDSLRSRPNGITLVQQPEVHLHPRAQAALGTFFCRLAKVDGRQFVIETHSDYVLDRVRMEVAGGSIKATDVNIAYLERKGLDLRIHQLTLDDLGNITNAPRSYREFFLEEETRLLSRGAR